MAQPSFDSILNAVMLAESGGRRYDSRGNLLTSDKGAKGEMQVLDTTKFQPGFGVEPAKANTPDERARVGRDYLRAMLDRYGDIDKALAAYNWGPGNTDKWIARGADPAKLPAETQGYISKIKSSLTGAPRTTAQASATPEAAPVPTPARGAPAAAPVRVSEARPADLGASYQAALALSFLSDEDEKESGRREYDERQPSAASQWLARETRKVSPESLAMPFRSPFPEPEPVKAADGGFIAVGYQKGGEARSDRMERIKRTAPGVATLNDWARTVAEDMYPREADAQKRDAARHMMASAIMANKTSPTVAEMLGKAYEFKEAPFKTAGYWLGLTKPRPDYPTDTANNALGTRFADVAKDPLELQRAVRASIERGEANLTPDEVKALGYAEGGEVDKATARGMLESLKSGEGAQAFLRGLTMLPQNIVGAPVDVVTMALRPFGYSVEKPVGGSDWLKEKSRQAGVAFAEPTDANARALYTAGDLASNLINPAGATRAAVRGVKEVGEQAGQAAKMLRELKPPSGPDLAPAGVPAEALRKAPEKSLEELVSAPMKVEGSNRDFWRLEEAARAEVREGKPVTAIPKERMMQFTQPVMPVGKDMQWVRLTDPRATILEGGAMNHSIGEYSKNRDYGLGGLPAFLKGNAEVYSLRDRNGFPVVTMEVEKYKNGERRIHQIKGPSNSDPSFYRREIFEFMDNPDLKVVYANSDTYRTNRTGKDLADEVGIFWNSEFQDWKQGMLDRARQTD